MNSIGFQSTDRLDKYSIGIARTAAAAVGDDDAGGGGDGDSAAADVEPPFASTSVLQVTLAEARVGRWDRNELYSIRVDVDDGTRNVVGNESVMEDRRTKKEKGNHRYVV